TVISRAAYKPRPAHRSRLPVVLAAVAALLIAGVALAAAVTRGDEDDGGPEASPTTVPMTVRETVTLEGTTVVETVTTAAEPTEPATTAEEIPTTEPASSGGDPIALNDQGFALMQAGNYEGALPLLEQSVAGLAGSGQITEAYASYNLAFTRRALGRCDGVLDLLARSEQVQGKRKEIDRLRREAEKAC
ncbi:MAG: tetratricopeptide repeat protein, partial [Actinobacteria bacterium]|nr:tetratricopeptide repeat protein [Actinomycetota bacterium]